MITSHNISSMDRGDIISYLKDKKLQNPNYKIIDVGGSVGGWSHEIVDAIVDFNASSSDKVKHFQFDINLESSWSEVLNHVKENGKFDFCICAHTLEDIVNPSVAVSMFNLISKAGYIATPSKYRELSYWECNLNKPSRNGQQMRWLGYIHHRWIYDIIDGQYTAFPKLNFIDTCPFLRNIGDDRNEVCELNLYWEDSINLKIMNDGYLGPSMESLINYYEALT